MEGFVQLTVAKNLSAQYVDTFSNIGMNGREFLNRKWEREKFCT